MNIQDALDELDPTDDDQWTADGMPRVDVVAELVGSASLKRADITNARPDFTRESSNIGGGSDNIDNNEPNGGGEMPKEATPGPNITVKGDDLGEGEAPDTGIDPAGDDLELAGDPDPMPVEDTPLTPMGVLQAQLEEATTVMYTAQREQEVAKKTADEAADTVNSLNRKIEVLATSDPNHATSGIRAYLIQTNKTRLAKAGRLNKFFGDSGVSLKDVAGAMDTRSPIDQAMAGRKPARGSQRPTR